MDGTWLCPQVPGCQLARESRDDITRQAVHSSDPAGQQAVRGDLLEGRVDRLAPAERQQRMF